jgi:predicted esterase
VLRPRRLLRALVWGLAVACGSSLAAAQEPQKHRVEKGQRLGSIAKRYGVSLDALLTANDLERRDPIRPGQELWIPPADDVDGQKTAAHKGEEEARAADRRDAPQRDGLQTLAVQGAPPAYYYEPIGSGRLGLKPVLVYLHGRGGQPASDCQRWAAVGRRFGWVLCPSGHEDRGGGARGWGNDWPGGHRVVMAALQALRDRYERRVQLRGNTLIGFSEGAYVAMNVGVREPRTFNRWLILAADADYWGGSGVEALKQHRGVIKRVYLITGEQDTVVESTRQVRTWIEREAVPVRASMPSDMGHEVPLARKAAMYRAALTWLDRGDSRAERRAARR